MRHGALVGRKIDRALRRAAFGRGYDPHVQAFAHDFGKQHRSVAYPGEPSSVGQEPCRFSPGYGNRPGIPSAVWTPGKRYSRAIGTKYGRVSWSRPIGEFDRFTIGERFDVNLTGAQKSRTATEEGDHAPIRRQSGSHGGIAEVGELGPF